MRCVREGGFMMIVNIKVESRRKGIRIKSLSIIMMLLIVTILTLDNVSSNIESNRPLEKKSFSLKDYEEGEWIPVADNSTPEKPPLITPISSDTTGITIQVDIYGVYYQNATLDGKEYSYIKVPSFGVSKALGKPAVPLITQFIEVPQDVDVIISMQNQEFVTIQDIEMAPAQKLIRDYQGYDQGPVIIDDDTYSKDEFYPSIYHIQEGNLEDAPVIIRGHRVLLLTIFPVKFNPIKNEVQVYTNVRMKLEYNKPSQISPIPDKLRSEVFEEVLEGVILNYNPDALSTEEESISPITISEETEGAEYLIITTSKFHDLTDNSDYSISEFAKWKKQKGLITKIVTEEEYAINGVYQDLSEEIRKYILNAYNTWDPVPEYILIIGDTEDIPACYEIHADSESHGCGLIGTDVYYGAIDGIDPIEDIYVGRFSVDFNPQADADPENDLDQLHNVIEKVMQYEKNPILEQDFYSSVTGVARFDDPDGDGKENAPFIYTSDKILNFLYSNHEKTPERIYSVNPELVYTTPNHYCYWYGENLPMVIPDLTAWDAYWQSTSDGSDPDCNAYGTPIVNSINDGRFLVFHRNHAVSRNWGYYTCDESISTSSTTLVPTSISTLLPTSSTLTLSTIDPPVYDVYFNGWHYPNFHTEDHIWRLTENEEYPVIFNVDCMSGWYDAESDWIGDPNLLGRLDPTGQFRMNYESLCEAVLRLPKRGAVALFGASRTSYSGTNDDLLQGFIDAIWDDFIPSSDSGTLHKLSQVLSYGKDYMITQDFLNTHTVPDLDHYPTASRETFDLYNLFGDPNMEIRTEVPENLNVACPSMIGSTVLQSFVVRVTDESDNPIQGASVCLYREADIFETDTTDSKGHAIFDIIPETGIGEPIKLTVTMHNYIPFQDDITVTDDGGGVTAVVSTDTPCIVSFEGELFGETGLESIQIFINTQDGSQLIAKGISDVADGEFTYLWDTTGFEEEDIINIMIYGTYSERAAVTTLEMPLCYNPDPYLYCQYSPSTWHLNPGGENPTWDNPDIEIVGIDSMDFVEGVQYSVKATIHNDKSIPATDTHVHFYYHAFGIGVGSWNEFKENTITVPAGVTNNEVTEATFIPPSSGQYCIVVSIHNDHDGNNGNNIGSENLYIEPVSSPNSLTIPVSNPTSEAGYTYIEVKQIGSSSLSVWDGYVEEFTDSWIEPGESHLVTLTFDCLDDAQDGDMREFVVTSFIHGELIGGVNIIAMKQVPPTLPPNLTLALVAGAVGGALIVIVILIVYIYRRKK